MNASTALLTDKYELTMLDAALASGVAHHRATFEAFARKIPDGRRYGVVAGTQRVLDAIKDFSFSKEQIDFLRNDGALGERVLDYLTDFKFSGNVTAYREGELYFPYSPVLTVDGTFGEAVLLETVILSILNHDCAVAGAASRMTWAAKQLPVLELGARRTHEGAAVSAARAAYIVGFAGTSNLEAGHKYGIPVFGTSAHAFTLAHNTEREAFEAQIRALGKDTTLLVDTYDIPEGIRTAVAVAGPELGAIRIDSGDLRTEAIKARTLLDCLGAINTKIVVSSDLDEFTIEELMETGAPINSFGAGTRVVTGSGHPTASMVYKLVAIENPETGEMRPVAKKSAAGKISIGGRKRAWRTFDEEGFVNGETLHVPASQTEDGALPANARDLQVEFMRQGAQVFEMTLDDMRKHHKDALAELHDRDKQIGAGTAAVSAKGKD